MWTYILTQHTRLIHFQHHSFRRTDPARNSLKKISLSREEINIRQKSLLGITKASLSIGTCNVPARYLFFVGISGFSSANLEQRVLRCSMTFELSKKMKGQKVVFAPILRLETHTHYNTEGELATPIGLPQLCRVKFGYAEGTCTK